MKRPIDLFAAVANIFHPYCRPRQGQVIVALVPKAPWEGFMRAVISAVIIAPYVLPTGVAKCQTAGPPRCENIQDQQSRAACFAQAGVPVIDCSRPRDADETAFCRNLRNNTTNAPPIIRRTNEVPSFDCAKAKTAAARLICADGDLARVDGDLGVAYQKRKTQLPISDQLKFAAEQVAWIKERDARCNLVGNNSAAIEVLASYKPCMMSMIRDRIGLLTKAESIALSRVDSVAIAGQSEARVTASGTPNNVIAYAVVVFVVLLVVLLASYSSYRLWRAARVRRAVARKVAAAIRQHLPALVRRREQLVTKDAYGKLRLEDWAKEIEYFIEEHIKPILTGQEEYEAFMRERSLIASAIAAKVEQEREVHPAFLTFSDDMTPDEFETYCAEELRRAGWDARVTMRSRDQGVDVVAEKRGVRVVLQCKLYSRAVGNKAVQEAAAGRAHEQADYEIVVSNSRYTHDAEQLASTNGILLIHYRDLRSLDDLIGMKASSAPRSPRADNSEHKGSGLLGPASSL